MPIRVACPECKKELSAPDDLIGRTVACPRCKNRFTAQLDGSVSDPGNGEPPPVADTASSLFPPGANEPPATPPATSANPANSPATETPPTESAPTTKSPTRAKSFLSGGGDPPATTPAPAPAAPPPGTATTVADPPSPPAPPSGPPAATAVASPAPPTAPPANAAAPPATARPAGIASSVPVARPVTAPKDSNLEPPVPAPSKSKPSGRAAQAAKFISADPNEARIQLGADGQLPQLTLLQEKKEDASADAEGGSNPVVLGIALVVSLSLTVAMLLLDFEVGPTDSKAKDVARQQIEQYYIGKPAEGKEPPANHELKQFQRVLRRALQAHNRGDRREERRLYRRVLNMLHSEAKGKLMGVTGMAGARTPPNDNHLQEQLSVLLK